MEIEFSGQKKRKTKKKLKLFRSLTVVFALLFLCTAAFAVVSAVSSSHEIENLKKQIDGLRNDLTEMTNKELSYQSKISELSDKNDLLKTSYDKLNADTLGFQTTVTSLQSQIEQLTADKGNLSSEVEKISKDLETVRNTNKSLSDRNSSLSSQLSSLNQNISTLKNENKALRETIEDMGGKIPEEGGTDEGDENAERNNSSSENKKVAYLTFDDGVSKYTNEILDILAKYNVKATFFPNWKGNSDEKYKRIIDEGHAMGNHTYSHEYADVYTSLDGFISEITKLNTKIAQATGYTPVIFRFPGGSNNTVHRNYNTEIMQQAISALSDLGMQYYDWNVNSGDADSSKGASKDTILSNVLARSTMDKAVILMHDTNTKGTTVAALPEIIEGLIAKGYSFGTLLDPDAPIVQSLKPAN